MSTRRRTRPRSGLAAAVAAALAVAAAGCGGEGDGGTAESSPAAGKPGRSHSRGGHQPLGEVKNGDVTLSFQSAKRDDGGFVTVSGKLTNNGSGLWLAPSWSGDETELAAKNGASMAGAKLVDKRGKKRYYVLRDTEGRCLCTVFQGGVQAGKSKDWYAQFPAPPRGKGTVDFQIADMPPASLEISGGR